MGMFKHVRLKISMHVTGTIEKYSEGFYAYRKVGHEK